MILVGDSFVRKTAKANFLHLNKDTAYATNNMEVIIKAGDPYDTNIKNFFTARINNAMVQAFNEVTNMPKMVVVILESDLIDAVSGEGDEVIMYYGRYLEDIIDDFHKIVKEMRQILPENAMKRGWPRLVFIIPTTHRNYTDKQKRQWFIDTLLTVVKYYDDVWALKLIQVWDENNCNIFSKRDNIFSREGLQIFWSAVDRTMAFCSRKITREELKIVRVMPPQNNQEANRPDNEVGRNTEHNSNQKRTNKKIFWNRDIDSDEERSRQGQARRALPKPRDYHHR